MLLTRIIMIYLGCFLGANDWTVCRLGKICVAILLRRASLCKSLFGQTTCYYIKSSLFTFRCDLIHHHLYRFVDN